MNIQELATIAENRLDIKICVFNNGHLGLVRQQQELFYGKRYVASRFDIPPDFAAIARGFGIPGCTVRMPHDEEALTRALAITGPVLLDIEVPETENVYPMVPPGKSNVEAIWSHGREHERPAEYDREAHGEKPSRGHVAHHGPVLPAGVQPRGDSLRAGERGAESAMYLLVRNDETLEADRETARKLYDVRAVTVQDDSFLTHLFEIQDIEGWLKGQGFK